MYFDYENYGLGLFLSGNFSPLLLFERYYKRKKRKSISIAPEIVGKRLFVCAGARCAPEIVGKILFVCAGTCCAPEIVVKRVFVCGGVRRAPEIVGKRLFVCGGTSHTPENKKDTNLDKQGDYIIFYK